MALSTRKRNSAISKVQLTRRVPFSGCHKGPVAERVVRRYPNLLPFVDLRDVAKAAEGWPQLNFIVHHGGYRFAGGGRADDAWRQCESSGRIDGTTDQSEIPAKHGVKSVDADVGQLFAQTTLAEPRLTAVMLGQPIQGKGADHVVWGTHAIWPGSPQWQIEVLRRLKILEALQKKCGYAPLGAADGLVECAHFGGSNARLYKGPPPMRVEVQGDRLTAYKMRYDRHGAGRTNLAYGYGQRRGA